MDSELLTCLLKFIEYFPDYLSALSCTLFWTTFVETAVYSIHILLGHPDQFNGDVTLGCAPRVTGEGAVLVTIDRLHNLMTSNAQRLLVVVEPGSGL